MLALLEGYVAPSLVARFPRCRNQASAPQLGAAAGIVGSNDTGIGSTPGPATASRDHPAIGDDRTRAVGGGVDLVVEDAGFPDGLAAGGVQREHVVVVAGVDD